MFVVRSDFPSKARSLECLRGLRMAVDSWSSCRGHLLPAAAMGWELYASTAEVRSGGPVKSCKMVAEGEAGE